MSRAAAKLAVGFAALWVLSPIDLIPEFLPVIGPLDDVVVVALALRYAARQVPRSVLLEAWPANPAVIERLLGARSGDARRPRGATQFKGGGRGSDRVGDCADDGADTEGAEDRPLPTEDQDERQGGDGGASGSKLARCGDSTSTGPQLRSSTSSKRTWRAK